MFYSHAHDVTFPINIYIDIFTYLFSLMDFFFRKFDMSSIRIRKIFHFHVLSLSGRFIV